MGFTVGENAETDRVKMRNSVQTDGVQLAIPLLDDECSRLENGQMKIASKGTH